MFLILSGAYIGPELQAEFGSLPPSFLPLGNKRLFQHQVALAPENQQIFLSLPDNYELTNTDKQWLDHQDVTVVSVPATLSLGQSLCDILAQILPRHGNPLQILFGDTLLSHCPIGDDLVATTTLDTPYNWSALSRSGVEWLSDSQCNHDAQQNNIVCGYFTINQPQVLISAIEQSEGDFVKGLDLYHTQIGLTPIAADGWLDFGHVNTYYASKASFTTQRAHNNLTITPQWIEKSSRDAQSIDAEANWYQSLPLTLRHYTPQFLGSGETKSLPCYRLEYIHNISLSELFVFSANNKHTWEKILQQCFKFLDDCRRHEWVGSGAKADAKALFTEKTDARLQLFQKSKGTNSSQNWSLNNQGPVCLNDLLTLSQDHLPPPSATATLMHGDFCFSNILYDFRSDHIKTIDPRGLTASSEQTIYGDANYDLAKLSHSVLGLYDWIIAGYHDTTVDWASRTIHHRLPDSARVQNLQRYYLDQVTRRYGLTPANHYAMLVQLFLAMLPLHSDDPARQDALFASAFRLHQNLQECLP